MARNTRLFFTFSFFVGKRRISVIKCSWNQHPEKQVGNEERVWAKDGWWEMSSL